MPEEFIAPERPASIDIDTHDLPTIHLALSIMLDGMNKGPKSRERALVITKLQEAKMWATEAMRFG